ncbi:hypothetical protein Cgig2_000357 [Carnegiea gigantea]|uniref:Uncharacterized protein n=1 Tax=Carnegiea gigantea TaxID=171969 RepID=A0A9Q1K2Q1_9CARY|nr:hypothetical protein Cgig2_000357 [Carnegiea gigantea]
MGGLEAKEHQGICEEVEVKSGRNGVLTYQGGSRDCVWVRQNIRVDEVKLAEEIVGEGLKGRKLWYNTKYDRSMWMLLHRDVDVCKLIKSNDEFACMYIANKDRPMMQPMHVTKATDMGSAKRTYCLDKKSDKRKTEMQKWGNGVAIRIENNLRKELEAAKSVIHIETYNRVRGEYNVQLSNSRSTSSCVNDETACDFFRFVDPEYTTRSMMIIDVLVEEHNEARDKLLGDPNERYWAEHKDMKIKDGLKLEVEMLKNMLGIYLAVTMVFVAIIVRGWTG